MKFTTFTLLSFGVVAAIVAVVIAFTQNDSGGEEAAASDLDRLAAIALTDYEGRAVSLGDYRGKPLVLNSWAVWCPFCRAELPDFATLQEEFQGRIVVIAVDRREALEDVKAFTDELSVTERMTFLLDPGDAFYKTIGGFSMPETIFVDESGAIVFHKRGPLTLPEMRAAVQQHLQVL